MKPINRLKLEVYERLYRAALCLDYQIDGYCQCEGGKDDGPLLQYANKEAVNAFGQIMREITEEHSNEYPRIGSEDLRQEFGVEVRKDS